MPRQKPSISDESLGRGLPALGRDRPTRHGAPGRMCRLRGLVIRYCRDLAMAQDLRSVVAMTSTIQISSPRIAAAISAAAGQISPGGNAFAGLLAGFDTAPAGAPRPQFAAGVATFSVQPSTLLGGSVLAGDINLGAEGAPGGTSILASPSPNTPVSPRAAPVVAGMPSIASVAAASSASALATINPAPVAHHCCGSRPTA